MRNDNLVVRLQDLQVFDPRKWASTQYGNYYANKEDSKKVSIAPLWLESMQRRQLDSMTFAPGQPPIIDNRLNRWTKWGSSPNEGDVTPWLELLTYLFPNAPAERKFLEQWFAYPIQNPGAKLKTAVVLIGLEGIGKNSLILPVERIYGDHAINIGESELYGDFCPWKKDKQLIVGNEVHGGRDKRQVMDKLKDLITAPTMIINEKFIPQYQLPNVANFIFTTNHPDPFYLAEGDRRFFVWNIPQERRLPAEFFTRFYRWAESAEGISALHCYLKTLSLEGFNPNAPAPMTEAKSDMIELGRSKLELFLREKIDGPCDLYTVDDLLAEFGDRNFGENAVRRTLLLLKCPKAYDGKQLKLNGRTVRLWILAEGDERVRLLAIKAPSHLAEEWNREREQTRGHDHGTEKTDNNGTISMTPL